MAGIIGFYCHAYVTTNLTFGLTLLTSSVKYVDAVARGIGFLLVGILHFTSYL